MGAALRGEPRVFDMDSSLDELALLAQTAGIVVVGRDSQNLTHINPGTYIGSGKVEELKERRAELNFSVIIFDDELSPAQLRNLERELGVTVLDRTALILDIFAMHARTREGALQVELAQYAYRLPRLTRQWTHLSRQGVGGVGLRGPGETQLESDRREIGRRMTQLRRELEQVRAQRSQRRRTRRRRGLPTVAIVGYTNAGKSTLLNRLADADVLVQDQLFATLDPTTRRISLAGGKQVLVTDTVGFIQKLPTQLVAAFRATLEEVREADLLVHVVDVSDPHVMEKVQTVEQVLREIEAADKPVLMALNKIDLVDPGVYLGEEGNRFVRSESLLARLGDDYEYVIPISAQKGLGIRDLLAAIEDLLMARMVDVEVTLPYQAGDLLSLWHEQGVVESQEYTPAGVRVVGKLPRWALGILSDEDAPEA
jgi:GTPase